MFPATSPLAGSFLLSRSSQRWHSSERRSTALGCLSAALRPEGPFSLSCRTRVQFLFSCVIWALGCARRDFPENQPWGDDQLTSTSFLGFGWASYPASSEYLEGGEMCFVPSTKRVDFPSRSCSTCPARMDGSERREATICFRFRLILYVSSWLAR